MANQGSTLPKNSGLHFLMKRFENDLNNHNPIQQGARVKTVRKVFKAVRPSKKSISEAHHRSHLRQVLKARRAKYQLGIKDMNRISERTVGGEDTDQDEEDDDDDAADLSEEEEGSLDVDHVEHPRVGMLRPAGYTAPNTATNAQQVESQDADNKVVSSSAIIDDDHMEDAPSASMKTLHQASQQIQEDPTDNIDS